MSWLILPDATADPLMSWMTQALAVVTALGTLYGLGCAAAALRRKLRRRPAPEVGDDVIAMLAETDETDECCHCAEPMPESVADWWISGLGYYCSDYCAQSAEQDGRNA